MQHDTATDYKDINFVNRFEENHGGIIKYILILIHLNRKIILKLMVTSTCGSPVPLSPSLVCFNAKVESKLRSVSETLSFTICIMFVSIQ